MGDVGDYWREHKDYLRKKAREEGTTYYAQGLGHKRRATPVRRSDARKLEKLGFKKCSDWHWQATVDGDLLDYWPSKSKWRYRGVTHSYEDAEMLALLKGKSP
jgi:hypothetical protein